MKTTVRNTLAMVFTLLLVNMTASAQWAGSEVFSSVNNTKDYTTLELASMDPNLSTFVNMVKLSGLAPSMLLTDAHTVFIPTNDAFRDLSIEKFAELTDPKNQAKLAEFVKYHFLPSKQMDYEFKDSQVITDPSPNEISVSKDTYDNVFIGGAKIIRPNIEASNGVIHIVNDIITPNRDLFFVD
ncbi:fasciclin domain-containing protein [Costertonia aggregata]|uniref:Fasciclin domain-containing protein n=1 Tax=Costertonia aggregata TaxID=343403 RepID=A0A7H9ASV8_9FLAO|nr:fasciclin domain-containing protein [Costertonia aggregata]QLG46529.1 fasciclin domain-containing protein [Costertonia aggregata]